MIMFRTLLKFSSELGNIPYCSHLRILPTFYSANKKVSSQAVQDPIVVTDDGSTIVCWHPEKEFPYEFTKPLPDRIDKNASQVLKTSEEEAYKTFTKKPPEFTREELAKLTFTTKHRWYPRSRDKRAKKTPMDRKYL